MEIFLSLPTLLSPTTVTVRAISSKMLGLMLARTDFMSFNIAAKVPSSLPVDELQTLEPLFYMNWLPL